MNTCQHELKIFYTILILLIISSCSPGNKIDNFKKIKKDINQLYILPPAVDVKIVGSEFKMINDTFLTQKIQEQIIYEINDLLDRKYESIGYDLNNSSLYLHDTAYFMNTFNLLNNLKKSKGHIEEVKLPEYIRNATIESNCRYFIGSLYYGYNMNKEGLKEMRRQIRPESIVVPIVTLGMVYVYSSTPESDSHFYSFLYDKLEDKIVFYQIPKRIYPCEERFVFDYIRDNLKTLYYK